MSLLFSGKTSNECLCHDDGWRQKEGRLHFSQVIHTILTSFQAVLTSGLATNLWQIYDPLSGMLLSIFGPYINSHVSDA